MDDVLIPVVLDEVLIPEVPAPIDEATYESENCGLATLRIRTWSGLMQGLTWSSPTGLDNIIGCSKGDSLGVN